MHALDMKVKMQATIQQEANGIISKHVIVKNCDKIGGGWQKMNLWKEASSLSKSLYRKL